MTSLEESNRDISRILHRAYLKFLERNAQYRDSWKRKDVRDAIMHIISKATRLETALHSLQSNTRAINDADVDDAIDLIVYACFFIAHVDAGRIPDIKEVIDEARDIER